MAALRGKPVGPVAATGAAFPVALAGPVRVARVVGVPVGTTGFSYLHSGVVLFLGDSLQVIWPYAATNTAEVVDVHSLGNAPVVNLVRETVGKNDWLINRLESGAVSVVATSGRPKPAGVSLFYLGPEPSNRVSLDLLDNGLTSLDIPELAKPTVMGVANPFAKNGSIAIGHRTFHQGKV